MIDVCDWKPADGLTLEPNALLAATEQQKSLALTAGPGAGKTEMLAQRADFLLRTGISRYPKRILAISFKVDASNNLKERVKRRVGVDLARRFDSYTFHAFAKQIIDRFRPILTGDDALDNDYKIVSRKNGPSTKEIEYSDLIPLAIKIIKNSILAKNAIRQTYSDVFLDEFQDCTTQQYKFLKVAFGGANIRLTAVGDTKQRIMGWAGAMDGIFKVFVDDFFALPLNMYRNFRSEPRLLRLQNEIIKTLDPDSVMEDKELAEEGGKIVFRRFEDCEQEAHKIAEKVESWIEKDGIPPSEIAILISKQTSLYAHKLIKELELRGIPFRDEQQMQDIAVEPISNLIVDYLSCLYGQREPDSWLRLMGQIILFEDDEYSYLREGVELLLKQQRKEVFSINSNENAYSKWWKYACAFLKLVDIDLCMSLSPDYESREWLRQVISETKTKIEELMESGNSLLEALQRFKNNQFVRILTIHKSKGLEFDSVIIMAVDNEIFFGNQDENRCAFFVAVSRAKRKLLLSFSSQREKPSGFTGRWSVNRSVHTEYYGYIESFLEEENGDLNEIELMNFQTPYVGLN